MVIGKKRSQLVWGMLFLLPALAIYITLMIAPVFQSIYMSFFTWNGIARSPMVFVGLKNYSRIFSDSKFWKSLINVGWFLAGGFIVLMPISFVLAHLITKKTKTAHFYKTVFFFPVVLPMTAVGLMWTYLLYPDGGLIPQIMDFFHLPKVNFLGDPDIAIISVVLVNEWIFAGLNMLIFAAGLVAIPGELYESAMIAGASGWQQIRFITLPLMKDSFKIFCILCVTGCVRHFDLVFVMTGGGPSHATEVPATLLYNEAFKYRNFGTGNAIGVFILILGISLSYLMNRLLESED
ncbi:MAG: sugar ABC transporter permease [Spirochaetia bacterium]|nr:sugar ABC transporter permease [Spirochaetia bacterium]MCF7946862.1 sugar ABC transporter permease [Spirochaetia bacterium]